MLLAQGSCTQKEYQVNVNITRAVDICYLRI